MYPKNRLLFQLWSGLQYVFVYMTGNGRAVVCAISNIR